MNKTFERQVLKLRPSFRVSNGHFYITPVEHILCGFVYEKARGGSYVWRYALPLYDHVDFVHLTFGERLPPPAGNRTTENTLSANDAEGFIRWIGPVEASTSAWRDIRNFLCFAESRLYLANPWIQRGHAMTLIMLGRGAEAESELQALLKTPGTETIAHFRDDLIEILAALSRSVDDAQQCLLRWEAETKARLGIQAS